MDRTARTTDQAPARPTLSPLDQGLAGLGRALAALAGTPQAARPLPSPVSLPAESANELAPGEAQRQLSGALMRVNHVGEVCAQALYEGQAATTTDPVLQDFFRQSAAEEADHLAWTRQRLDQLGARPSLLNPVWYAGAFALGALAGRMGDRYSLGFTVETERQVEQHLAGHLDRLPQADTQSRAIVQAMQQDEIEHARQAERLGAVPLPGIVRGAMRFAARIMTTAAHRI